MAEWLIEPLADGHERGAFPAGRRPSTTSSAYTPGSTRKKIGRTFVALRPDERVVVGYYTLAASSVSFDDFPAALVKKLLKHPVSTILLGRLAVDQSAQGQGLGGQLLMDAARRVMNIADEVGVFGIHTHAIDDAAKAFYSRFGFGTLHDQERHLFMPVTTIQIGLGAE